jgi:hypothetical protein
MSARRLLVWSLGAACVLLSAGVKAQGTGDALAQARAQLRQRNLDSAVALLRRITDSATWADTARRLNALVLAGIVRYYMGENVMSAASFRAALEIDPALVVPRLAEMDSTLGALFDSARVEVAREPSRDTLYSCSPQCEGLEVEPRLLDAGTHQSRVLVFTDVGGDQLRGGALLRAIVDTLGHVEPGSIEVVRSTLPQELLQSVLQGFLGARYRPGRAHGRTVRVLIERSIQIQPRPQH